MTARILQIAMFVAVISIAESSFGEERSTAGVENVSDAIAAVKELQRLTDLVEVKAKELKIRAAKRWADRVGDLAADIEDELDDLAAGDSARDVHQAFGDLHGAYLNLRNSVKHVANPKFRKEALLGTLDQFDKLHLAIYGIGASPLNGQSDPKSEKTLKAADADSAEELDVDGLPRPIHDNELDGVVESAPFKPGEK
jgi:hypothetical protein